jgi:simple sugar transport system permease protein
MTGSRRPAGISLRGLRVIEAIFSFAFIAQGFRISIPYIFPALGATYAERGGVVNIALEGMLLVGGFATAVVMHLTGNLAAGVLAGVCAGTFLALLHGAATISGRVNQIVVGIALNLFALGLTKFLCQVIFQSSSNSSRIEGLEQWSAFIAPIPFAGVLLGNPFLLLALFGAIAAHVILYRTRYGLRLRAVGEHPEAADTLGISVVRMRYSGLLVSGALCGLGGAWLALDQHSFTDGMTAGRGFIALAAMIIGKWKPIPAALASLFFGFTEALVILLQGGAVPVQFIQMIPYVLTMVVLAGFIGRATPPAADGIPYEKGNP